MKTSTLPSTILSEFQQFKQWHDDMNQTLTPLQMGAQEEIAYLNKIFPKSNQFYLDKVERMGALTIDFSKKEKKELFEYISSTGLHETIKKSDFFYHSIFKPRGYAGDAAMMALIYRNTYEGSDTFSKLLNRIGTECAAGIAIRNRKDLMCNILKEMKGGKVMSLAAGSAREMQEYLEEKNELEFLALDHDIQTLREVEFQSPKLTYGIINAFHLIKGKNNYLIPKQNKLEKCDPRADAKGIKKILLPLKYKTKKLAPNSFDLIYSQGLFDYIDTFLDDKKGTIALTHRLFDLLKPNGRLLIGNISPLMPKGVVWSMECLFDWYLIYRTKEEVMDFASSIPRHQIASISVIAEETGVNWFLDIRKK